MKSFSAGKTGWAGLVTLALAGAVAVALPAAADPTGIALIESLTGNPSGVEVMDYVRAGQVIRLAPHQTIVLSYMASCVRETITGGTVTACHFLDDLPQCSMTPFRPRLIGVICFVQRSTS
jgi:hypothetical protein